MSARLKFVSSPAKLRLYPDEVIASQCLTDMSTKQASSDEEWNDSVSAFVTAPDKAGGSDHRDALEPR